MENILFRDFTEVEKGTVDYGSSWSSVDHIRLLLSKISDQWLMKINDCRNEKTYKLRLGSFYLMVISDVTLAFVLLGETLLRSGHITHFIVPLLMVTLLMFLLIIIIKNYFVKSQLGLRLWLAGLTGIVASFPEYDPQSEISWSILLVFHYKHFGLDKLMIMSSMIVKDFHHTKTLFEKPTVSKKDPLLFEKVL